MSERKDRIKSICLSNREKKSTYEKSDSERKTRELVRRFNRRDGRRASEGEI